MKIQIGEKEVELHNPNPNALPEEARHHFNKFLLFESRTGDSTFLSVNAAFDSLVSAYKRGDKDEIAKAFQAADYARNFVIANFSPSFLSFACLEKGRTDFSEEALAETVKEWKAAGLQFDTVKAYCEAVKKKLMTESQSILLEVNKTKERLKASYESILD